MLSIPKRYRNFLREQAAATTLQDPEVVESASSLATKYLCEYLDQYFSNSEREDYAD